MTPAQKKLRDLRERRSKERQRLAELGLADSLTDESRAELDTIEAGTPDLERQIRAATVAAEVEEGEQREEARATGPDAELQERIALRSKASLGAFLIARMQGREVRGAEHELRAAAGVEGVPLELWDVPEPEGEGRAVAAAPGTTGINLDPLRPALFAPSIAPRLGIAMPRVATGTYATGTITGSQMAEAKGKSAAIDAVAGAFTVGTSSVKRISARLELTLEDIASVGAANFEPILRENLSLALSDAFDAQAIAGDGNAPNLTGILTRLTDPSAPGAAVATFDDFVAAYAGGIDGLWASMASHVGIVVNPETYQVAMKTFRDAAGQDMGDMAFADYAMQHFGGFWTNKRMPVKAAHVAKGILYRKGRAGVRTAVCPHWGEVQIDDMYSGAAKAERSFTMHVLVGDVILIQPDAYAEVAFRVST